MNILDELVAKGVSGEVIVAVAKLIANAQQNQERRAKNAERMRAVRARAHTSMHTETQKTSPKEVSSSKEGSVGARSARRAKTTPLPDNFHPELADNQDFKRFCNHARDKARKSSNWEAAWENWRDNPRFNNNSNGGQQHGRRHGSVLDAADRLIDQLGGEEAARRYVPGSEGPRPLDLDSGNGPPNLRLVPPRRLR